MKQAKIIDIEKETLRKLKHICADEDTNPKEFIEKLIEDRVNKNHEQQVIRCPQCNLTFSLIKNI